MLASEPDCPPDQQLFCTCMDCGGVDRGVFQSYPTSFFSSWLELMESVQSRHQSSRPVIPLGLEDMGLFSASGIEMQVPQPANFRPAVKPQRLFLLSSFCYLHWMWTAWSSFEMSRSHVYIHLFLTEELDDEIKAAHFLLKLRRSGIVLAIYIIRVPYKC